MSSLMNRVRPQQGAQNGGAQARQSGTPGQNGKQGQQPADARAAKEKRVRRATRIRIRRAPNRRSAGQSGQQPASKQPGSGIGRQDGSKDVKLAEQLAAMGKISEIIGKRSANVTGELTVEVTRAAISNCAHPMRSATAQHTAGRRRDQSRRSAGRISGLRAAVFRAGAQAGGEPAKAPVKRHTEVPKPGM